MTADEFLEHGLDTDSDDDSSSRGSSADKTVTATQKNKKKKERYHGIVRNSRSWIHVHHN